MSFSDTRTFKMALSVTICQQHLDQYLAAELAVLGSQSYTIGGRSLTRANLAEIREGIKIWSDRLDAANMAAANGSGMRMRRSIPHDR